MSPDHLARVTFSHLSLLSLLYPHFIYPYFALLLLKKGERKAAASYLERLYHLETLHMKAV